MKIVEDRIVVERVPLRQCDVGDKVSFPHNRSLSGEIIIVKIKAIPKGKIQIKYRSAYVWRNRLKLKLENVIQKADLPDNTVVERKRKADRREYTEIKEYVGEILT